MHEYGHSSSAMTEQLKRKDEELFAVGKQKKDCRKDAYFSGRGRSGVWLSDHKLIKNCTKNINLSVLLHALMSSTR